MILPRSEFALMPMRTMLHRQAPPRRRVPADGADYVQDVGNVTLNAASALGSSVPT
jgi:hypothetical protein